jgi:hypothetical protein
MEGSQSSETPTPNAALKSLEAQKAPRTQERLSRTAKEEFAKLRLRVREQVASAVSERVRSNPQPTAEEYRLGAFAEELEPQVRNAVLTFTRKGYATRSSGFWGEYGERQVIEGAFTLDVETQARLKTMGVAINQSRAWGMPHTTVLWHPDHPDLASMMTMWDRIANLLPDLGRPASPAESDSAEAFRNIYSRRG